MSKLIPWHVVVLIPARNEEMLLPRCLQSVERACARLPSWVTYDVVVAVDSSTDLTLKIARDLLRDSGAVVVTEAGVVGQARALAAEVALTRYTGPRNLCWIANTDADCCVPETWLLNQLQLATANVEAVAGIVQVDDFAEHAPCVQERFHAMYLLHADGTHPHVHGANLGVRADAYLRAGGWSELATAEDHDLWNRLRRAGSKRVSDTSVHVVTSGRKIGRAPLGFADTLCAQEEVAA